MYQRRSGLGTVAEAPYRSAAPLAWSFTDEASCPTGLPVTRRCKRALRRILVSVNCGCTVSTGGHVVGLPKQLKPRFLSGLSKAELNAVLSHAKHRRFTASSVVLHQGDPAERLFLLTSGQGRHFVTTHEGRKIPLHWLTAGQIFGGVACWLTPSLTLPAPNFYPTVAHWCGTDKLSAH